MGMQLEGVVPWGRSFDEYVAMFALSEDDLKTRILACADGPAAFNAGMRTRGRKVVSVDPLYVHSPEAIRRRIDAAYGTILRQVREHRKDYVWDTIRSPEELGRVRMTAMAAFLDDFTQGAREGRYVAAAVPSLPFRPRTFDLSICSHFLFVYSDQLSATFHLEAILEMCRVADQVRIFPLVDLDGARSPHVAHVQSALAERGYGVSVESVPYTFVVGADEMMVVDTTTASLCSV
jgi:hypothetical protein